MRIIGGKFRGKKLAKSDHLKNLRPTTDKNREALFNILSSGKFISEISFKIDGARVLDVCCGSGAVAFEAISRGAKEVVLIDNHREHLQLIRQNLEILNLAKEVKVIFANAKRLPANEEFFDLIFIDPPYAEDYQEIISSLLENGWIKKDSLIVVEFKTTSEPEKIFSKELFRLLDLRRYGQSSFAFLKLVD